MSIRSEQEEKISNFLFSLMDYNENLLEIKFTSASERCGSFYHNATNAKVEKGKVILTLDEVFNPTDLELWVDAITKAEMYLNEIKKDLIHQTNSPNFYKAMKAQQEYNKLFKLKS